MSKRIRGGSWLATREISFKMCWFIPNNFCMKIWKTRNSTAKWWSTHFRGVVIARQWLGVMASCHLQSQPCTYVLTNQATIITMHTNRCYPFYSNIGHVFVGTRWSENWLCKKKTYLKFRWSNQLYSLPCFPFLFYSSKQMPVIFVPFFDRIR